jgi:hypothetical protein
MKEDNEKVIKEIIENDNLYIWFGGAWIAANKVKRVGNMLVVAGGNKEIPEEN